MHVISGKAKYKGVTTKAMIDVGAAQRENFAHSRGLEAISKRKMKLRVQALSGSSFGNGEFGCFVVFTHICYSAAVADVLVMGPRTGGAPT